MYGLNYVSDLVHRQSKRVNYKNSINKRFKARRHILLNSILNFTLKNNINKVFSPTADLVMKHTDSTRSIQKELFEMVHDRSIHKRFYAKKQANWRVINLAENSDRIIKPKIKQEIIEKEKTICLCHDIERGLGHINIDQKFAESVNKISKNHLEEMLIIEEQMNIKATYNVLGCLFNQVRKKIEKGDHCIAFHSYDHTSSGNQLKKCRTIDYRVIGYRPPGSNITSELSDKNLCYYNFKWIASSIHSIKTVLPRMDNRIVKIPIMFDDFEMYANKTKYQRWEQNALKRLQQNDYVAFCLHDCYAHYWLPYYEEFLKKISRLGKLKTMDTVANEIILGSYNK